jgi:hypothetical protein
MYVKTLTGRDGDCNVHVHKYYLKIVDGKILVYSYDEFNQWVTFETLVMDEDDGTYELVVGISEVYDHGEFEHSGLQVTSDESLLSMEGF